MEDGLESKYILTGLGSIAVFGTGVLIGYLLDRFCCSRASKEGADPVAPTMTMKEVFEKRRRNLANIRVQTPVATHKMVFVVRTDLKMGKGKIAAQCSHAAVNCFETAMILDPDNLDKWDARGRAKICLKIEGGEDALIKIQEEAEKLKVVTALIADAGHTQVDPGTVTVLGVGPAPIELIDKITGHLKLM